MTCNIKSLPGATSTEAVAVDTDRRGVCMGSIDMATQMEKEGDKVAWEK